MNIENNGGPADETIHPAFGAANKTQLDEANRLRATLSRHQAHLSTQDNISALTQGLKQATDESILPVKVAKGIVYVACLHKAAHAADDYPGMNGTADILNDLGANLHIQLASEDSNDHQRRG